MSFVSSVARLETRGRIAVLLVDSRPVNALGQEVRRALTDAVAEVAADEAIDALVIGCEGRTFFAGADIREFGLPPAEPLSRSSST